MEVIEGNVYKSNNCGEFEVLEIINQFNIKIKFIKTGYETFRRSSVIKRGFVKDPLFRSIRSIGFIGVVSLNVVNMENRLKLIWTLLECLVGVILLNFI